MSFMLLQYGPFGDAWFLLHYLCFLEGVHVCVCMCSSIVSERNGWN